MGKSAKGKWSKVENQKKRSKFIWNRGDKVTVISDTENEVFDYGLSDEEKESYLRIDVESQFDMEKKVT